MGRTTGKIPIFALMTADRLYDTLHRCALTLYGTGEAGAIAFFILEEMFGIDRASYALDRHREVDATGLDRILHELSAGRPVQYITGRAWFAGLKLEIGEGALVPRPETEELVLWVESERGAGSRVLDIGTGSGAIAITLARRLSGAKMTAVDISAEALGIARRNASLHGAAVDFRQCDILAAECRASLSEAGPYDAIVSNPPYIPASEAAEIHINVKGYEPAGALFVPDDDPLLFYRAIAPFAAGNLTPGGAVYFEVHRDFAGDVADLLEWAGLGDIEVRRDIHGRDRMVRGVKTVEYAG